MKIQLREKSIMKIKNQRGVLPWTVISYRVDMCAPPSYNYLNKFSGPSERTALCVLRSSMTVEAALVFPFFLMILLAFFSFFSQYASAAEAKALAAAEAKAMGVVLGLEKQPDREEIVIYQKKELENLWLNPFQKESCVVQQAVCRAWIGFTELDTKETYVYVTPEGSVYHLFRDCTHLDLSIKRVTMTTASAVKNEYGERYQECELCEENFGAWVYITSEGNRYHSGRTCSGLKRTIRQIPLREVQNRSACIRCMSRKE